MTGCLAVVSAVISDINTMVYNIPPVCIMREELMSVITGSCVTLACIVFTVASDCAAIYPNFLCRHSVPGRLIPSRSVRVRRMTLKT